MGVPIEEGEFVKVVGGGLYSAWGNGKLQSIHQGIAQIAFFNNPTTSLIEADVPELLIRQVRLPVQTRAYWEDPETGRWHVGRVLWHEEDSVGIRFPNQRDAWKPVSEVHVRWNRPIKDPTPYLAKQINETPLFADARSGFMRTLISQRAACQGMSGLISSVIELEPHQMSVVRRVLQDPVQRYLLADEVGLGKTIEAGVIIRQYVLDDPIGHKSHRHCSSSADESNGTDEIRR